MTVLILLEIVVGILLIGSIVLQMQGSGLSTAFGGSGEFYRSKRSIEKLLLYVTGVLAGFFAMLSILLLLYH